jgi:electron transport complex protein RnfB
MELWQMLLISIGVVAGIAIVLGLLLAIAHKYLAVKEDKRVETVTSMLPGANCGGCGFPGCSGLANALVEGTCKKVGTCRVAKPQVKEDIKKYLEETPGPDGNTIKVEI